MSNYFIRSLSYAREELKKFFEGEKGHYLRLLSYALLFVIFTVGLSYALDGGNFPFKSQNNVLMTYNAPPVRLELADSLINAQPVLRKFRDPSGCALSLLVTEAVLGISPETQLGIMALETAATYSHTIRARSSSATGLYQFVDETSEELSRELKLPDLKTEWRQLRAGRLLFEKRQKYCISRHPKYDISRDKVEAYIAILYPSAPCTCRGNDVILRGRAAIANPAFHVDRNNYVTYRWEIAERFLLAIKRSEVNFN